MDSNGPRSRPRGDVQQSSSYLTGAGVGLQFALTFLAMGALGWWLDGRLGSSPLFLILGILVGAAGAMYSLVRRLDPRSLSGISRSESSPSKSDARSSESPRRPSTTPPSPHDASNSDSDPAPR